MKKKLRIRIANGVDVTRTFSANIRGGYAASTTKQTPSKPIPTMSARASAPSAVSPM